MSSGCKRCSNHPWANYFKNMSVNRTNSAFNLVDVYRRMGDVPADPRRLLYEVPPSAQASVARLLQEMSDQVAGIGEASLLIGFQPGASQGSRQWPSSAFARLGKALCAELGGRIVVFGTEKEAPLGEAIVKECHGQAVSVMGKTSVAQLAALLQRCRLLVTNDTGTMHLACALGTQVVALFMGLRSSIRRGPTVRTTLSYKLKFPVPLATICSAAHTRSVRSTRAGTPSFAPSNGCSKGSLMPHPTWHRGLGAI